MNRDFLGSVSESTPLRLATALAATSVPLFFYWGTYRSSAQWFPVPPIPWLHLTVFFAVLGLATIVGAFLFSKLGHPINDALLGGVVVMWSLSFFWRLAGGLASVLPFARTRATVLAVVVATLAIVLVLTSKAMQKGHGGTIAGGIAVIALSILLQYGWAFAPTPQSASTGVEFAPNSESEVWVIVVDELSSPMFLQEYGDSEPRIVQVLEDSGFTVSWESTSPYGQTYPALSSMLSLEPIRPGLFGAEFWSRRASIFGGDHPLSRAYVAAGRDVVLVEPPIKPAFCSDVVTDCYRSMIDDFDRFVLSNTAFWSLVPTSFGSWAQQGLIQMNQLDEIALEGGARRLVLAHLMLAHAPYVLDENCADTGVAAYTTDSYLAQVECFTTELSHLLAVIPTDTAVLIVSDHGISLGEPYPMSTPEQRAQRLSSFVAIRGCDVPQNYLDTNVNAYRGFVNCVSTASFSPVALAPTLTCYRDRDTIELLEISGDYAAGRFDCDN